MLSRLRVARCHAVLRAPRKLHRSRVARFDVPETPHRWTVAGEAAETQRRVYNSPEKLAEIEENKKKGWNWRWKVIFAALVAYGVPAFYIYMIGREPRFREMVDGLLPGHMDWLRRTFPASFHDEPVRARLSAAIDRAVQAQPVDAVVRLRDGSARRLCAVSPHLTEPQMLSAHGIAAEDVRDISYEDSAQGEEAEALSRAYESLLESVSGAEPLRSAVPGSALRDRAAPAGAHYYHGHPEIADRRKNIEIGGEQVPYHHAPSLWLLPEGLPGMGAARGAGEAAAYPTGAEAREMLRQIAGAIRNTREELRRGTNREIDAVMEELTLLRQEASKIRWHNWTDPRCWFL